MKLLAGALGAALLATPALAEPCRTQGDANAQSLTFPSATKEIRTSLAWVFVVADKLEHLHPDRSQTCSRGPFRLATQVFAMSGENGDAVPRKAVSIDPDGPVAMLVPLSVQQLRLDYPDVVPKGKGQFYLIAVWADGVLTGERILRGIPTDERLIAEFGQALMLTNTMAKIPPGSKKATLLLPLLGADVKGQPPAK